MQDREQFVQELCNRIIPRLTANLGSDVWISIETLDIQDTILVYKNAQWALDNNMLEFKDESARKDFAEAIDVVYKKVIQKIKDSPALYVMVDKSTRLPFVDDKDGISVFSKLEYSDTAMDHYLQQYRVFEIKEIPHDQIEKFLFSAFYVNGAKNAIIDNGYRWIRINAEDIVSPPAFKNIPQENIPITNPNFVLALTKFNQERFWRAQYTDKNKELRRLEDEFITQFAKAKFLIPVRRTNKSQKDQDKSTNRENKFSIPILSRNDDNDFAATPVFTSWYELTKLYEEEGWDGWVWTAEDLLNAPDNTIVIDAMSLGFEASKKFITNLFDAYKNEICPEQIVKDLLNGQTYYIPFCYANEETPDSIDDSIHYTFNAAISKFGKEQGEQIMMSQDNNKFMRFIKLKNKNTNKEYLALFSSVEKLRSMYPAQIARICLCDKEVVEQLGHEAEGIVVDLGYEIDNKTLLRKGLKIEGISQEEQNGH